MKSNQIIDPEIKWLEANQPHTAHWRAENGSSAPKRVLVADDTLTADAAYRLACEGSALLWRGDFQNAKQLLQALARRVDAKSKRVLKKSADHAREHPSAPPVEPLVDRIASLPLDAFHLHRRAQSQRARTLSMLLIPFKRDYTIPLRRAPDVRLACAEAWGSPGALVDAGSSDNSDDSDETSSVAPLRELLGIIGAHEWRRKGVDVVALDEKIHPHYGVFAPIRGEYVSLVAEAMLAKPPPVLAFDVGTGSGVLAAILAKHGVKRVIATDQDLRAVACARENLSRLKLNDRVNVIEANLFPEGRAPLVVCNPPWLPARPSSPIERAIYDPESGMLRGFLSGLTAHLEPGGEGWLILSDLAEHLFLRSRDSLLGWIDAAGLIVSGKMDVRPTHPRASDAADILHIARAKEITSLWRLKAK